MSDLYARIVLFLIRPALQLHAQRGRSIKTRFRAVPPLSQDQG